MRGSRTAATAAVACAAVLGLPAAAGAHGESSPEFRTVVDRMKPELPGVRVTLTPGDQDRLVATNDGTEPLEVLGNDGVPFLRLGPRGAEANVNSLDWYRSGNAEGMARPPREARIGGSPRWVRVGRGATWAWYDHRLHPTDRVAPDPHDGYGRAVRVNDFAVPVRQGDRAARIEGHVDFRPLPGVIVPKLESSPAPAPGVSVSLMPGQVPGLFLINTSDRVVSVRGQNGEPFARVGPRGAEVNVRSATYADDRAARGEAAPPPAAAGEEPRWRRVSDAPRLSWLESRAWFAQRQPPEDVIRAARRTVLKRWTVPIEVDGREATIAGTTTWEPSAAAEVPRSEAGAGSSLMLFGAPVLLGLAAAGVATLRARRSGVAAR